MALPRITPYALPTAAELPAPRGPWRPQRDRIALLVHDMQRYFLAAFDADAAPLQPAVANMQADLWGPGMRRSDEHEPIIDALAPQAGEHVLVKHRYSAFQRSNLETLMRVRGRDQLLVTGVYAHIGCTATVAEAFQRDIEAFIAADAVADFSRADHDQALHWIARTSGVPMTTDQLLEVL